MKQIFLSVGFILASITLVLAQVTPTPSVQRDTIKENQTLIAGKEARVEKIESYADKFVPRKASLYAAVFPGLGQIYNKSYWKLPIVYGGFVALGLTVDFYDDQYDTFRKDLFVLLEDPSLGSTPLGLSEEQARNLVDKTRRERDFWMIMTAAFYFLQIAEAHIDAHLKEFKLNPRLQVSVEPSLERNAMASYQTGFTIKIKF